MKKNISKILLTFVFALIIPLSIFAGCGSTYKITFMKATSLTYLRGTETISYVFAENTTIEIKKGEVIGSNNEPDTTYGTGFTFKFDGWYTDKNFNYKWDLNKDEVKTNLTLYPKYIYIL